MATEISQSKTICILAIVAGCFAILWPSLFYPMLKGSFAPHSNTGCCHVMSITDVNMVKILTDLCDRIIEIKDKTTKFKKCSQEIFNTCTINITLTDLIREHKVGDISYNNQNVIDKIRSLNGSLCLKYHYGVSLTSLGVTHRLKDNDLIMNHIPQERTPVHLRASKGSMHPALMEKGRAIPQPHIGPRHHGSPTPHSFKPPIPGSRPPMGGMGGAKITGGDGGSAMNILMPMYTIGILLFFVYTMMKLMSKKDDIEDNTNKYSSGYACGSDTSEKFQSQSIPIKLGCIEKDTRDLEIDALRRKLEETEAAMERIVKQMILASECNGMDGNKESKTDKNDEMECLTETISDDSHNSVDENINNIKMSNLSEELSNTPGLFDQEISNLGISGKKIIQVVNMETSESVEGGRCWTPTEKEKTPSKNKTTSVEEPISLIIPGMIPKHSQVLISDGPHNTPLEADDHEAVISSKVTLSLIPDDRVEEYLTSDDGEGDNTTLTQSNIN